MELLLILFIVLTILTGLGIAFLYLSKNLNSKNISFYCLSILSIVITFLNVTSLPSNYLMERFIALSLGLLAVVSLIIRLKTPQRTSTSNFLVTASVLGGLIYLIFFIG